MVHLQSFFGEEALFDGSELEGVRFVCFHGYR